MQNIRFSFPFLFSQELKIVPSPDIANSGSRKIGSMFEILCTIWWYIQAAVWSGVALSLLTYLGTSK
jgi:hypothetical protein